MTNKEPKLNNLHHETFAQEVAKNMGNYTQAYIIAYPDASPETAQSNAYALAKRPEVAKAIQYYKEQYLKIYKETGIYPTLYEEVIELNKIIESLDYNIKTNTEQIKD